MAAGQPLDESKACFVLNYLISRGPNARIYKGTVTTNEGRQLPVAIKKFLTEFSGPTHAIKVLGNRAEGLAQLRHPNIARIFQSGAAGNFFYLVMEHVHGFSLETVLEWNDRSQSKIHIPHACHIVAEASKGLAYAHQPLAAHGSRGKRIIHGDISASNILVTSKYGIKIVGFSLCGSYYRGSSAPEGLVDTTTVHLSRINESEDLAALGSVLFELLSGKRNFLKGFDFEKMTGAEGGKLLLSNLRLHNSEIDSELDAILLKLSGLGHDQKYDNAAELYNDLTSYLDRVAPDFLPEHMHSAFGHFLPSDTTDREDLGETLLLDLTNNVQTSQEKTVTEIPLGRLNPGKPAPHSPAGIVKPFMIGNYAVLEKIAEGGMAEIFLARNSGYQNVNRFFSIKRIRQEFAGNPTYLKLFENEARLALSLEHPNIINSIEFGTDEKLQPFFVSEYVHGKALVALIQSRRLGIFEWCYIFSSITDGLRYAHNFKDTRGKHMNIIHRDLCPQNIMVSFTGQVKILDFGIAIDQNNLSASKTLIQAGKMSGVRSPEWIDLNVSV